jgi:RNA-directed DNA polymerase
MLDLDIKGFFDNIPPELLMKAVRKHTECKWVLLYIERWLKAAVQHEDGTLRERTKGTPQGAVISPLLANLFLHYCMDEWLRIKYPQCPFERYADDSVIHCQSKEQAEQLKEALQERLKACGLEMHQDKTRIVYCKDEDRNKSYPHVSFDFLGYTFRSRKSRNRQGKFFTGFLPAVSDKAGKAIREKIREWKLSARSGSDINTLAAEINPVLRGWINYYGHYYKSELQDVLKYLNLILKKWARQKYKKLHSHKTKASKWLVTLYQRAPYLFAHWRIGVRP